MADETSFVVIRGPLSIRETPNGKLLGQLSIGAIVTVDPNSRTEAGSFVWWQHQQGWSAERTINNTTVFMKTHNHADLGAIDEGATLSAASQQPAAIPQIIRVMEVTLRNLAVRDAPRPPSKEVTQLPVGTRLKADLNSRTKANGFVWIKHTLGWSKERTQDRKRVFMKVAPPGAEPTIPGQVQPPKIIRTFRVTDDNIRIRQGPYLSSVIIGKLNRGERIDGDLNSRTKADGYVWIQHERGWSAERNEDRTEIFLNVIREATPPPPPPPGTRRLMAISPLNIRVRPSFSAPTLSDRFVEKGQVIEFDERAVVDADGMIWVQHTEGWTVWKKSDNTDALLVEIGSVRGLLPIVHGEPDLRYLPGYRKLIKRLPVNLDQTQWFQYFGNNVFAYDYGHLYNYDGYSQGVHGGLDFGNNLPQGMNVYAGLTCKYWRTLRPSFGNEQIWTTRGDYLIIYQHLMNARVFTVGQELTPDTVIGDVLAARGYNHLHFEIRYQRKWIVNPLLLMPNHLVNQITAKFDPNKSRDGHPSELYYFFKNPQWTKWTTPLEQPPIVHRGSIIGPRGAGI